MPGITTHLITHPEGVEHVLKRNQKNHRKSDSFIRPVSLLAGRGLLTNEGESWLRQRRLAQPAFHRKRLAALAVLMAGSADLTVQRWAERQVQEPAPVIDVLGEMTRLTLGIASQALFSIDYSDDADRVGPAVRIAFEYLNYQMNSPFALPVRIYPQSATGASSTRGEPLTSWSMTSSGSANTPVSILETCCRC